LAFFKILGDIANLQTGSRTRSSAETEPAPQATGRESQLRSPQGTPAGDPRCASIHRLIWATSIRQRPEKLFDSILRLKKIVAW